MKVIFDCLDKSKDFYDITFFDCIESTNTTLKDMAKKGEKEGKVIIAKKQTGGRGKLNRKFFSPEGSGIYMSILLRPDLKPANAVFLTALAAVSVAEALETVAGIKAEIKWVNDIYCKGKKLCGILTESGFGLYADKVDFCVVGIGINLKVDEMGFPEEIKHIAGVVFDENEFSEQKKNRIISEVLERFYNYYTELSNKSFVSEYKRRSNVIGRDIVVSNGFGENKNAFVLDIDNDCRLIVRYNDGKEEKLISGDVSIALE